ncbi:hypothetical protein [Nostoc sp. 'Peltigera membranacea cyanobiont' N6]|uniref:hypothetical protein n=1 Tax=Nostoc sp. 'Peltigera membranacea cyanobiont' N6 TaxID=1261031 RepID=UPI0011B07107|nr:hypothetical protein [Nostoc sp. 'Peltigera membranacea cyanobiont' N6]
MICRRKVCETDGIVLKHDGGTTLPAIMRYSFLLARLLLSLSAFRMYLIAAVSALAIANALLQRFRLLRNTVFLLALSYQSFQIWECTS